MVFPCLYLLYESQMSKKNSLERTCQIKFHLVSAIKGTFSQKFDRPLIPSLVLALRKYKKIEWREARHSAPLTIDSYGNKDL